jgi:small subunit ribosomal protein S8e
LDVVYNATNNELVRTKTLVKNTVIQVDATPFKQYYLQQYDVELGKKKKVETTVAAGEEQKPVEEKKKSKHVLAVIKKRQAARVIDPNVVE